MADRFSKKLPPWVSEQAWPTAIPEKNRLRLRPEPALRNYQPTSRDRMVGLMADYLYGGGKEGYEHANNAMNILDWTPVGALNDTYDAGRAIGEGRYGDAALMAGFAILPGRSEHLVKKFGRGLPGKSLAGSKSKPQSDLAQDHLLDKELASKLPISYAPKPKPQRGFKEDYPNGAAQDETGRLLKDIEGRELTAPNIIGRRMVGEPDSPATPAQIRSVGKELVGQGIETVAPSDIRGGAGLATFDRHLRAPLSIKLSNKLSPLQAERTLAHEVGHVIDEVAGQIPTRGLEKELNRNFSAVTTGREGTRHLTLPEHIGYKGEEIPREKMATAIYAYMLDPNYFKTVAPKTAKINSTASSLVRAD